MSGHNGAQKPPPLRIVLPGSASAMKKVGAAPLRIVLKSPTTSTVQGGGGVLSSESLTATENQTTKQAAATAAAAALPSLKIVLNKATTKPHGASRQEHLPPPQPRHHLPQPPQQQHPHLNSALSPSLNDEKGNDGKSDIAKDPPGRGHHAVAAAGHCAAAKDGAGSAVPAANPEGIAAALHQACARRTSPSSTAMDVDATEAAALPTLPPAALDDVAVTTPVSSSSTTAAAAAAAPTTGLALAAASSISASVSPATASAAPAPSEPAQGKPAAAAAPAPTAADVALVDGAVEVAVTEPEATAAAAAMVVDVPQHCGA